MSAALGCTCPLKVLCKSKNFSLRSSLKRHVTKSPGWGAIGPLLLVLICSVENQRKRHTKDFIMTYQLWYKENQLFEKIRTYCLKNLRGNFYSSLTKYQEILFQFSVQLYWSVYYSLVWPGVSEGANNFIFVLDIFVHESLKFLLYTLFFHIERLSFRLRPIFLFFSCITLTL